MFCKSGFIFFYEIGEKPCAEHHESNNRPVPQKHWLNLRRIFRFFIWDFRSVKIIQLILSSGGGGAGVTPYILYGTDVPLE